VDSVGGGFTTAGGFGINYGILTKDKNGLTPGQAYKGWARTWCDPAGGPYRSVSWTSPIFWSQPTSVRVDGSTAITNLDVYPNPSRGEINIVSEHAVKMITIYNTLGEVVSIYEYDEYLPLYIIDIHNEPKGIYTLKIKLNNQNTILTKVVLQ
jgi:hypothetical protein